MCGIITAVGKLPSKKVFEDARDTLSHRGPDDSGLFYDEVSSVALGHRRLSIIDLSSAGHQPMWSQDKRYAVVFNGEIYNYLELKKELADSYTFTTNTDTEVLLAGYSVWGKEILSKLNGMFSFMIWDTKTQMLFGARDRLGIKPLYYYYSHSDDTLYTASEIKGLLALGVPTRANESIIYDYLAHGLYDHRPETFFDGIKKLPAGHSLTYVGGKISIQKYWDLADVVRAPSARGLKDVNEMKKKFLELFSDSIALRLRSDVPVGVNLSSGLDSNALLFFAENNADKKLPAFTVRTHDKDYDEGAYIEKNMNETHKDLWHTTYLEPKEATDLIQKVVALQDEPFGGIPSIAYYQAAHLAKDTQTTVVLEGQGGDELFAGYAYYLPENIEKTKGRSQDMSKEIHTDVLRPEFVAQHSVHTPQFKQPFTSSLKNAQYRDIVYSKLPRVLRFNDRFSMAHGREYREPFLDHRLVEFAFFLPDELKINGTTQKFLLREAMKDIIPEQTRGRSKKAFGAIQTPWFRTYMKDEIMDVLTSDSFKSRPYWDADKAIRKAKEFFDGEGDNSFFLWQWVNLEYWLRRYLD